MLGTEKRVRATHGEGVDDETLKKYHSSSVLAFVAFVLAVGAILLGLAQYTDLTGKSATSANTAAIATAQNRLASIDARLGALETANGQGREMLVNSLISDLGAKADFLADQGLTEDQMARLRQALAPVLPQPAAPAAAIPAAEDPAPPAEIKPMPDPDIAVTAPAEPMPEPMPEPAAEAAPVPASEPAPAQ